MSFLCLGCCEANVWVSRKTSEWVCAYVCECVCKQEYEWVSQWVRAWVVSRRSHMWRCFKLFPRLPPHRKFPHAADIRMYIRTYYTIYIVCLYIYFSSANKTSIAWYKLQITLNRLRLEARHGEARRGGVLDLKYSKCRCFDACWCLVARFEAPFKQLPSAGNTQRCVASLCWHKCC